MGCLVPESCLFILWIYRFLLLEVSAAIHFRRPSGLCWGPSLWRTEHDQVSCTVSFCRWLVVEGWLSWPRRYPGSVLRKADTLCKSVVPGTLSRKTEVPSARSFPSMTWRQF